MHIRRLEVENLRVFESASLALNSRLNVIAGPNGAGKTTLLEGVYILGTGRSFRSRRLEAVLRRGAESLRVFGEVAGEDGGTVGVGVGKGGDGFRVRIGGERVDASSRLAQELALGLITPESHRLLNGGPGVRRRALDWGLFHVEPGYHGTLGRYTRALRQRNAALRGERSEKASRAWDEELVGAGERVSRWREGYVEFLESRLRGVMGELWDFSVSVGYRRGWPERASFEEALGLAWTRDRKEGWTSVGPHRADLELRVEGERAEERLSRGQAKLFVSAFELAQVKGVAEVGGKAPVVLVDDLASELDLASRGRFLELLARTGSQVLVTAVEEGVVPKDSWDTHAVFHVEQGSVRKMV